MNDAFLDLIVFPSVWIAEIGACAMSPLPEFL